MAFQSLVRIEKKTKIRQLTAVVKGLRIYNWDCGRGGAGVDHLPSILNSAAEATSSNLKNVSQHMKEKGVNSYKCLLTIFNFLRSVQVDGYI